MMKFFTCFQTLSFVVLPYLLYAHVEPLDIPSSCPRDPDSIALRFGHCNPITLSVVNCATHTIELSAYISWTFTGLQEPYLATWNTGQVAHKITVTADQLPGVWTWDASGTGCEPNHWNNEYVQPGTFFLENIQIDNSGGLCVGGSTVLNVTSNEYDFQNYSWAPQNPYGDTSIYEVFTPGLYSLTVTDMLGCTFSDQVSVQLSASTQAGFTYAINGQTVNFTNTSLNASSYDWDFDNGLSSTQPNPTVTFTNPNIYNVCLTATGSCSNTVCQVVDLSPTVPWIVNPTGRNHTIILPANLVSDIQGLSLQSGDFIGVFYNDGGVQKCGGMGPWAGSNTSFAVYGNDATPPAKNGFNSGETFLVKVWQAATNQVFDVTAFYAPVGTGGIVTHTNLFGDDGISLIASITTSVLQNCVLKPGWNMISSFVSPTMPNMLDVFNPIASNVLIIKDGNGVSTIPSIPINGIGNWNVVKGYQVKANQSDTLQLIGQKVSPENTPIPLSTGWQIIAYLRDNPQSAVAVFANIQNQISVVKDNAGNSYLPQFGINSIGNLLPGQGYKVKAISNTVLWYQSNFSTPPVEWREPLNETQNIHFVLDSNLNTGNNAILVLLDSIANITLDSLDEIGIFTTAGVLCGASVYEGENLAITVWGDDLSTGAVKEGLQTGEEYVFRVWDSSGQFECSATAPLLGGINTYSPDAFDIIQHISFGSPSYSEFTETACASYVWNNQVYTESGVYSQILPNAAGCDSTLTLELTIYPVPLVAVISDTICTGETAILSATGAETYLWSTGETTNQILATPVSNTTYTVIGTSNGCVSAPAAALVTLNATPSVNLGSDTVIQQGASLTLGNPQVPGWSYLWSTGATTSAVGINSTGVYALTVTNEYGCTAADEIIITQVSSTYAADEFKIMLSPNPARDWMSLTVHGSSSFSVQVLDKFGRVILDDRANMPAGMTRQIALDIVPSGSYYLRVTGENFVKMFTIIKN